MKILRIFFAALVALAIASCGPAPERIEPADFVVAIDLSSSSPVSTDRELARKAGAIAGQEFLAEKPMLGDRVVVLKIGARDTRMAMGKEIRLDRHNRPEAVAATLAKGIADTPDNPERGQGETNILFTLTHSKFRCTPGRGRIWIPSDGIDTGEGAPDPRDLLAGKAELPAPNGAPLRHCRISWIGLGLTADSERQLSGAEIDALETAWRSWLERAGVRPSDISISTGI